MELSALPVACIEWALEVSKRGDRGAVNLGASDRCHCRGALLELGALQAASIEPIWVSTMQRPSWRFTRINKNRVLGGSGRGLLSLHSGLL